MCGFGLVVLHLGRWQKLRAPKGTWVGQHPKRAEALAESEWEVARKKGMVTFAVEDIVVTPWKERTAKEMDVKAEV